MSVNLNDFCPVNKWSIPENGRKFSNGESCYVQDETSGRMYLNDSKVVVRIKCLLLTLGTPFVHLAAAIVNVAIRALKVISFYHFWMDINSDDYQFKARLKECAYDLIRVVASPIIFVGLELSAIYGVLNPYDGRKLYATLERYFYNDTFNLAPCFQPDPLRHFFGGNMEEQNQF